MSIMREFHSFVHVGEGVMRVREYHLHGFDDSLLKRCRPRRKPIPSAVRLMVIHSSDPVDYLLNPLSLEICSERLTTLLVTRAEADVQIFDAPLFDTDTKTPIAGYKILNYLRCIECLDMKKSDIEWDTDDDGTRRIVGIWEWVLRSDSIPSSVHLFRCSEFPYSCFISDELAHDLVGKGLKGLGFRPIQVS